VPKSRSGWGRAGHRRAVFVGAVVIVIIAGGSVAAWAEVSGGSAGFRMGTVTHADIATTLTVVGNVQPVSQATASFQVGGQVATVAVTPGQTVTLGQTLGTLDTTALSEAVSSAQSTVQADEAKLTEDEEAQSSSATTTPSSSGTSHTSAAGTGTSLRSPSAPSTTTTVPPSGGAGPGQDATITRDQEQLTLDEATLGTDQQKEAADLAQAQTDCTSANTGTPAGQATCEAELETVSGDEEQVSKDQSTVSKDETALGQALAAASSGGSSARPTQSGSALSASTPDATLTADITGNSGAGATGSGTGSTGAAGGAGSANSDSPEQIASDQAAIDTAEAQLTNAQQSLKEATLTSPISGTVVSVGISAGDTVTADSSTETIAIIGTMSYEALATLDSSQVASVKTGQSASVEVDGVDGTLDATVAQVGPVESNSSGYSYPVVVALPATGDNLRSGSAANIAISTGEVSHVVAVPTSAVQTLGSRSYVLVLSKGQLARKVVKVGMVGDEYTQVLSGLTPGASVVLADYAESVPSSSTNTVGVGGLLGGGGGGFFGGGGGFRGGGGFFQRSPVGGGNVTSGG
jgi:multidrug efflux pump subunit AcrA (membrane-fusion protein)